MAVIRFGSIVGRYFGEDSRTTVTSLVGDFSDFTNAPGHSDETYENWLARSAQGNYIKHSPDALHDLSQNHPATTPREVLKRWISSLNSIELHNSFA